MIKLKKWIVETIVSCVDRNDIVLIKPIEPEPMNLSKKMYPPLSERSPIFKVPPCAIEAMQMGIIPSYNKQPLLNMIKYELRAMNSEYQLTIKQ